MTQILLIEDEVKLAQFIKLELNYRGYFVTTYNDTMNAVNKVKQMKPDLILIDENLSDLSGREICRRLRIAGEKVPIILLTSKEEISDRVAGLDAGADDYLIKTFSVEELITRIKVYLRQNTEKDPDLLQFLDLSLNKRTKEVHRGDRLIELTATEHELLEYLMSHSRKVLTRNQILKKVWHYDFTGDSNVIEVYIRYLRLKLEANKEPRLIKTVRGVGYVLRD